MFMGKLAIMEAGHILGTGVLYCATTMGVAGQSEEQRTMSTSWCLGGCQHEDTDSNPVLCGNHSYARNPHVPRNRGSCLGAMSWLTSILLC